MTDTWRFIFANLLIIAVATLLPFVINAQDGRAPPRVGTHSAVTTNIRQASCEQQERMFEKCQAVRGKAHLQCNRDFSIAFASESDPECKATHRKERDAYVADIVSTHQRRKE